MTKFIKLSLEDNQFIYIKINEITKFYPTSIIANKKLNDGIRVHLSDGAKYDVMISCEEFLSLISNNEV